MLSSPKELQVFVVVLNKARELSNMKKAVKRRMMSLYVKARRVIVLGENAGFKSQCLYFRGKSFCSGLLFEI